MVHVSLNGVYQTLHLHGSRVEEKNYIENRSITIKIFIVTGLLNHNTYLLDLTKLASGPLPGTYHKQEFTSRNAALKLKNDNRYTLPLVHATDIAC